MRGLTTSDNKVSAYNFDKCMHAHGCATVWLPYQ